MDRPGPFHEVGQDVVAFPLVASLLAGYQRTAFRLEQQRQYQVTAETESFAAFLAGRPLPPEDNPHFVAWFDQVRDQTKRGLRMERVRVQEDPPTDYQRWENWFARWNIEAGEIIRRMTRAKAHQIGLLPDAGEADWWLLDEERLIVMWFHADGSRKLYELVTDPAAIERACRWRDLAVLHSTPDTPAESSGA